MSVAEGGSGGVWGAEFQDRGGSQGGGHAVQAGSHTGSGAVPEVGGCTGFVHDLATQAALWPEAAAKEGASHSGKGQGPVPLASAQGWPLQPACHVLFALDMLRGILLFQVV